MTTSYTPTQVMMTLSALAATASTTRPSGEKVEEQARRILNGINAQLSNTDLATTNSWQALWVGLTQDRANLVYIAHQNNPPPSLSLPTYAVCLRGTMSGSPIDTAEDLDVSARLPFQPSANPAGNISVGAMQAFTEIIMGTTLVQTLTELVANASSTPVIYVTGHSLGGALATTVSLYLNSLKSGTIFPYTFAAPTAGDATFAAGFNSTFPNATCVFNQYDAVPNAWTNLVGPKPTGNTPGPVEYFYPGMPSGPSNAELRQEIIGIVKQLNSKAMPGYAQPTQQPALNAEFSTQDPPASTITTLGDWLAEVAYQHANNTYLTLLGAPTLPAVGPTVTSISPSSGPPGCNTSITITGTNFTPSSVVDFGVVPGIEVQVSSDTTITVTSPPGVGIVNVTVTNENGTSPVVSSDQFTYTTLVETPAGT